MDDNGRCTCCVCRDEIANPRILPCWHAACFTCILGLTQNGQGRAVSCPVCRQTSPFETVRSLPTPVKCVVCQQFVTNPQKFPCCNGLCCYDCIQRHEYIGGIACGNNCRPEAKYTLQNLFPARICPQCYSLHLGQARNCGHFICKRCNPDTLEAPRPCYVCQLASSPAPRPANPFAAAILPTQGIQPVDRNMIQQNLQQAGLKAIAFWILMLVMISTYGFCVWTWIVGLLALLAFRAVACPMCRQTLLFENIRSLPEPILCSKCGNFVINPRKSPCCNRLCCYDCAQSAAFDGMSPCVHLCNPESRYAVDSLTPVKLCPTCFSLHTEQAQECRHFLCKRCSDSVLPYQRCKVCEAAASAPPRPANPFAALLPNQPIYPGVLQENRAQDGLKMLIFFFIILLMILISGFSLNTWIVGILSMLILRASIKVALGTCAILNYVIFVLSFYYFYHALILFLLCWVSNTFFPRLHRFAPLVFQLVSLALILPHYEPVLLHRLLLDAMIKVLADIFVRIGLL